MVLEQHLKKIFFVILYIICLSKFAIYSQWPNENSCKWIKNVTSSSKIIVLYCSENRYVHIFFYLVVVFQPRW